MLFLLFNQSCVPLFHDPMEFSMPGFYVHRIFLGKNTGVGCHLFHHGIFPTQGLNPSLLHWQVDS